ncbi:AraC family transcriptional regulator [Pseudalkalibacillus hwajinpoensis]|uniref:Helix-turn-helix domain-containing protein n=1 Tax=Guptibacillus hwajinpoensis TaxID=208199 RepID=A0A4U1MLN7_9BACL|nr:AraC family transcriptional regulator [Pseudalkalibacillus hwajinpoensis]TKD72419.1 helix-turn-helix domain-containing protein [Pseudalkalibacillus hwajinpoensis]
MEEKPTLYGSYGYRFSDPMLQNIAQIWSLGWDEQTSSLYDWDGTNRRDTGKYIFQYTISGKGCIEIDGLTHELTPGQGFIVNIPGDYRYYLPDDSERWEFIYITLYGDVVKKYWNDIQEEIGHIIHFQPDSEPVLYVLNLIEMAASQQIANAHQASGYAYQFTMKLFNYCSNLEKRLSQWPEAIVEASMFAMNHYGEEIGPDEMAASSGMSRYHFTRQFKQYTNQTPIQYLTDIRIKKAKELLLNTKYSSEDIAALIGYKNANYFNKVFKKVTGTSPGKYRSSTNLSLHTT